MRQLQICTLFRRFHATDRSRDRWRVAYPLEEVLLLVTCVTICTCDDFEDILRSLGNPKKQGDYVAGSNLFEPESILAPLRRFQVGLRYIALFLLG